MSKAPLHHPAIKDVTVEGILHALSDPIRARIFADLAKAEGMRSCSAFVNAGGKPLAKSTLSQHFRVLRETGLIRSERQGVALQNKTRCAELRRNFGPMITEILKAYEGEGG